MQLESLRTSPGGPQPVAGRALAAGERSGNAGTRQVLELAPVGRRVVQAPVEARGSGGAPQRRRVHVVERRHQRHIGQRRQAAQQLLRRVRLQLCATPAAARRTSARAARAAWNSSILWPAY